MTPVQTAAMALSHTCPLCHTLDNTITPDGMRIDTGWTCTRCGQAWSAGRLAAVSAYATYVAAH
jgi:ribosomal protein L37AE/L43A